MPIFLLGGVDAGDLQRVKPREIDFLALGAITERGNPAAGKFHIQLLRRFRAIPERETARADLERCATLAVFARTVRIAHRVITETIQLLRELCGCQRASDVEFHRSREHARRQCPAFALELFPNNNVQVGKVSGDNNDDDHQY